MACGGRAICDCLPLFTVPTCFVELFVQPLWLSSRPCTSSPDRGEGWVFPAPHPSSEKKTQKRKQLIPTRGRVVQWNSLDAKERGTTNAFAIAFSFCCGGVVHVVRLPHLALVVPSLSSREQIPKESSKDYAKLLTSPLMSLLCKNSGEPAISWACAVLRL